ncbi:hypothetical protein [Gluconacetobacter entanii]|nr:hypothetical protein [Gluconacetobacter entanii]
MAGLGVGEGLSSWTVMTGIAALTAFAGTALMWAVL